MFTQFSRGVLLRQFLFEGCGVLRSGEREPSFSRQGDHGGDGRLSFFLLDSGDPGLQTLVTLGFRPKLLNGVDRHRNLLTPCTTGPAVRDKENGWSKASRCTATWWGVVA